MSYLPLSEITPSSMSEKSFENLAAVQKNANKSLGFRKRLITACQEEFRSAVCSVSLILYSTLHFFSSWLKMTYVYLS